MTVFTRVQFFAIGITVAICAACAPPAQTAGDTIKPQVTAADFANSQESIEVIIARKVPGVALIRNSENEMVLRIRGRAAVTSLGGGTPTIDDPQPLFVLDGTPLRGPDPLNGINRDDIAAITVLKGGDAAKYGIDGAAGVIVIETKHAAKKAP